MEAPAGAYIRRAAPVTSTGAASSIRKYRPYKQQTRTRPRWGIGSDYVASYLQENFLFVHYQQN